MLVINSEQYKRLVDPIAGVEGRDWFMGQLEEKYGIIAMKAHTLLINSKWDVHFIDDDYELLFLLKHSELLR